jgi:hypothetical protein
MNRPRHRTSARTQVLRLRRQVEELINRVERVDEADELAADLSRYICVRTVGFLEQSITLCGRSIVSEAWGASQRFGLSWLNTTFNPRTDAIVKFVHRFDERWAAEIETYLAENENGQKVNALIGIRNDIAHGRNQGVSRLRALEYFETVSDLVDQILDRFEPRAAGV